MSEAVENLRAELEERRWSVEIDRPAAGDGTWWLDVDAGGRRFVVAWSAEHGFGLSSPDPDAFGEGHDERYETSGELVARLDDLVGAGRVTVPPRKVALSRLRERASMTQEQIAELLDVQQSAVSKLERRDDMHISTLARLVGAMGGELRLVAEFDEDILEVELPALHQAGPRGRAQREHQRVVPHDGGWAVEIEGSTQAASIYPTKREAISAARSALQRQGGELTIHGEDGRARRSIRVQPDEKASEEGGSERAVRP
jgi:transcriptional regulator with XRE-family HTH domain